jgi:hypothetical protein
MRNHIAGCPFRHVLAVSVCECNERVRPSDVGCDIPSQELHEDQNFLYPLWYGKLVPDGNVGTEESDD